jgi:hypothetical protein
MVDTNKSGKKSLNVHKKGTPFKKPKKSGGSPIGVRHPPIFAMRKMKKIKMCVLYFLFSFALRSGLIKSIAEPVVPINEERKVPIKSKIVLNIGVPTRVPLKYIPPETVKSPHKSIKKGK